MNKSAKHRLVRFDGRFDRALDAATISAAIDRFLVAYDESPAKSFASNIGTEGLRKWARLLTDRKDKKGWPKVFPNGALAYLGLRRVYDGLEHEYTAPAGGCWVKLRKSRLLR